MDRCYEAMITVTITSLTIGNLQGDPKVLQQSWIAYISFWLSLAKFIQSPFLKNFFSSFCFILFFFVLFINFRFILMKSNWSVIFRLREEGRSVFDIAWVLNLVKSTASRTIKRYKELGNFNDRHRSELPRISTNANNWKKSQIQNWTKFPSLCQKNCSRHCCSSWICPPND